LNSAKDLLIKYLENQTLVSVVTASMSEIIKENNQELIKKQEYSSQVSSLFSRVSRRQTSKYKSIKNTTKFLGFTSGALTLFSTKLIPILPKYFGTEGNPTMTTVFAVLAALTGFYYLIFSYMSEKIKDSLDDFKDYLNDKSEYLNLLNEVFYRTEIDTSEFEKREFERLIYDWLNHSKSNLFEKLEMDSLIQKSSIERTARRIGESDFTKLILSKGLEYGYIIENETISKGFPIIKYSLKK
jgi:hypothetical protein